MSTTYYLSPFGWLEIIGSEIGICSVQRCADATPIERQAVPIELQDCVWQLDEYFAGKRQQFELVLDLSVGTAFHQEVWRELLKIPYGRTTSYGAIAHTLGDPKCVRAVGQANRSNPIAIIVPCHRVIAKNGQLQGYFYGLEMKRKLLQLENPMAFGEQGALF